MRNTQPVSFEPTVVLNGLPARRNDRGTLTVTVPLLVVSNRRAIALTIDRDAARDMVRLLGVFLDDVNHSHEPRCTLRMAGTVGGKHRTVSLVAHRVAAALLAARLDYLSSGVVLAGDVNALDP